MEKIEIILLKLLFEKVFSNLPKSSKLPINLVLPVVLQQKLWIKAI